jgi:hypothetical protein
MDEGTFKWWRAMMADLYNFGLKYFVIPDGCDNDALTNSFVDAQIEFVKKHDRKDDHFAVGLMEKFGEHLEDQQRKKPVLCDNQLSPNTAALIQFIIEKLGGASE